MITDFTESTYHEFRRIDFTFNGHTGTVIFPEKAREGMPWVWRAEFLGAFDSVDVEMVRRGWHLCYYQISDMFGNPESVALMKSFHDYVVRECGLSEKCDIFGFSRGGLYSFNFTCAYPACVSVLYLDAPVLDMRDWPCDDRYAGGYDYNLCPQQYHMTREAFLVSKVHPADRFEELTKTGVPVVLVAGDADVTVLFERNGCKLGKFLAEKSYDFLEIVKPGCDHHPHSLENPAPVADFIEKHR